MRTLRIMKATKLMTAVLAVMLCTMTVGRAELIPLASGRTIDGEVIRTNDTSITIRTKSGFQTYQFYELAKPPMDIRLDVSPARTSTPHHAVSVPMKTSVLREGQEGVAPSGEGQRVFRFFAGALLSARAGQILVLLGWILLVIQGFRVSILWGILNLLFSLVSGIIFLVFHPKQGILPFIVMLAGIVVFAMSPFWALWLFMK
jgi:hypothetical protein